MAASGLPSPFAEDVLDLVSQIPRGRAMSYGDVATALGAGSPRQVGHTMSHFGSGVPWWRVVRADGTPAESVALEALKRLRKERTPLNGARDRVDLGRARWHPRGSDGSRST